MSFTRIFQLQNENTLLKNVTLVFLSSFLIALMGQFAIHLPFTPVPISFRFQTILLLSVLIGSRRAFVATVLFIIQGALGLFPMSGSHGILGLIGPNGGYYLGFVIASFVVGWMCEKSKTYNFKSISFAMLVGTLIVYTFGAAYLSTFVGFPKSLSLGIAPFVLGDILKTVFCLKIIDWTRKCYKNA